MATEYFRSLGIELSGGKNDKTSLAVLDFYPKTGRLVLSDIESKLAGFDDQTNDEVLINTFENLANEAPKYTGCGVHAPLSLPPLFLASLQNESPQEFSTKNKNAEIQWMMDIWKRLRPKPRPFAPYMERAAEIYLRHLTREKFQIAECLGANHAPMAARMQFLKRHLKNPLNEVHPHAVLTRIIASLGLSKNLIRDFSDLEKGVYTREEIFIQLSKKIPQLFIYEKDLEQMVLNVHCLKAFLCALMQHFIFQEQHELPPKNFPRSAGWIHLPKSTISWDKVFGS